TEAKWKTVEDEIKSEAIGSYVDAENMDLMQVWQTQFKATEGRVLITDNGPGEYSLSAKNGGVDIDFSTRQVPGKVVDSATSKEYNSVKELIGAYETQLRPWKPEHEKNLSEALANAPQAPGIGSTLYNVGAWGWNKLWGSSAQPVEAPDAASTIADQLAQSPRGQPLAPSVESSVAQQPNAQANVPPQAAAPAAVNGAVTQRLAGMKPLFMNGANYLTFAGKGVNRKKAQAELMTQLNSWRDTNTVLSAQDAKSALKMLLLDDQYEQKYADIANIQNNFTLDMLPAPKSTNKNKRNEVLDWLWAASKQ
ncbi:MAG: hypothetical protein LLF94_03155, partial [Chlamydiales bacterium]|nr:hypothetical protein [Chlamydiales bacterium]